jgi:hypothetical protein
MGRAMVQALAARFPPRRTGFDPRPVRVGLVTEIVTKGRGFHRIFQVFPMSIIPPVTYSHLTTTIV